MAIQLTFGKFNGQYISQCPSFYVKWLANHAFDPSVREEADREYKHRTLWNKHWGKPNGKRFS
jgi:hypothetical protein